MLLSNVIALSYNYNCYFIFECPCQVLCCNVTGSGWLLNMLCYTTNYVYVVGRKVDLIDSRRLHYCLLYFHNPQALMFYLVSFSYFHFMCRPHEHGCRRAVTSLICYNFLVALSYRDCLAGTLSW